MSGGMTEAEDRLAVARRDFPGLLTASGKPWHYLDSAATAQKPQVVIDAVTKAIGVDYATVHRGVYSRSAEMTLGYEAARRRVAAFIGGAEEEIVFTRGATEAINLVAQTWGQANLKAGDRILLSELEHHSNIVPWQLLRDRTGVAIDVCPLTDDGRIDLDAAERMLTKDHRLVAFAHVSNVLGSVLEGIPAIVLFGPLLFPSAKVAGINEVHYAMVIILAMGIGLFAPPFGVGYYAACAIGRVSPDAAMRRIWPYLLAVLAGLIVVAAVPWFSTGFL